MKTVIANKEKIILGSPLLILECSGSLGVAFSHICEERNKHHTSRNRNEVEIGDKAAIEEMIKLRKTWAIINAAGYVKVDDVENNSEACLQINAEAPLQIANLCAKHEIRFITYCTDLVFDGNKNNGYTESDIVNPLNVYGKSEVIA